jgi:CubicO group peptidase (beta-lactamase class C family)
MEDYMAKWPFSGTVLIARQGEVLFREAYGQANLEHGVPNRTDTKFGVWSITKSFTALAIALLAKEGKLTFEDPVSMHVPEMASMPPITIRQAMHHISGLPNLTSVKEYNAKLNKTSMTRDEAFELFLGQPLEFEAGSRFAYNNTGYYLLGLIIEAVGGMSYHEWIANRILRPLDMFNTGVIDGRILIPSLASAYHASEQGPIPAEYVDMGLLFSTGGMYSTIEDLYAWALSFEKGIFLSHEELDRFFGVTDAPYGLGWFLGQMHGRRRIHHGGAYHGFRSELHRYPEDGTTVIVLTNYNYVPATKIADALAGVVFGEDSAVPERPPAYDMTVERQLSYAGIYEGFGCRAVVDRDDQGMFAVWNNREVLRMYPIAPDLFQHPWFQSQYSFKRDDHGELSFLGMKRLNT